MKPLHFYSLFLLPFFLVSQQQGFTALYDFEINLNSNSLNKKGVLYATSDKSLFRYDSGNDEKVKTKVVNDDNGNYHVTINSNDKIGTYQFLDFEKNKIVERRLLKSKYHLIKDDLKSPKWILSDSTKTMNSIKCNFASTVFLGREYYAWYAPSLPFNKGPWKLNGLPGLIVSVSAVDGSISWNMTKFTPGEQKIESPETQNDGKTITLKDFFLLKKKDTDRMKKFLRSSTDESVSVSISVQNEDIEKNIIPDN